MQKWIEYGGVEILFDRPLYEFDPTTKIIKALYNADIFQLQDWGFLGNILSSSFGIGGAGLKAVNSLPHEDTIAIFTGSINEYNNAEMKEIPINLLAISANGILSLEIDGQRLILEVNEKWEHSEQADFVKDGIEQHYQITSSVTNYGWLDRSQIQFRP